MLEYQPQRERLSYLQQVLLEYLLFQLREILPLRPLGNLYILFLGKKYPAYRQNGSARQTSSRLYLLILFRILVISHRAQSLFGKLLTICVGLPIIFQSFLNIGVALQVFPITGQTLPMISSGGTSVWITCLSFGIILSVSSFYTNLFPENELEGKNDNPLKILSETV